LGSIAAYYWCPKEKKVYSRHDLIRIAFSGLIDDMSDIQDLDLDEFIHYAKEVLEQITFELDPLPDPK